METKTKKNHWPLAMLFLLMITIYACGGSKGIITPEEEQQYQELVDLVNSREFEIVSEWAVPQSGNNVSLIGNTNFIRFKGDSVNVYLPYFGERYSGGGYGTSGGIEYKGPIENFRVEERRNQQDLLLRFEGEQDSENLEFLITLYPNGNANTSVTTSERSSITYRGEVEEM